MKTSPSLIDGHSKCASSCPIVEIKLAHFLGTACPYKGCQAVMSIRAKSYSN